MSVSTNTTSTNTTTITQITATTHFPIKLTTINFPVWRKQIQSTLVGLDLFKFLDGTHTAPPEKLSDNKVNPAYQLWFRQDQTLISALLGSCTETIQPIVSSANTSHQAWKRLSASYASASRSRVISLKTKLSNNPRGTRTITEFLLDMRSIADDLALAQSPIDDEDLLVHILSQLGDDFKSIVSALKVRENPIAFPELFDTLLDHERSIKPAEIKPLDEPVPSITTVNYSQARNNNKPNNNYYQQNQNRSYNSSNNASRSNRSNSTCHFCGINGHDIRDCRKMAHLLRENNITITNNPAATNNTTTRSPWLVDSGASHHITSDGSALHKLSDYGDPDEIVLGNGSQHGGAFNARGQH